jgi:hypothetical protein
MKRLVFILLALLLAGCFEGASPQRAERRDRVNIDIGLSGDRHEERHHDQGRGRGGNEVSGSVRIESH